MINAYKSHDSNVDSKMLFFFFQTSKYQSSEMGFREYIQLFSPEAICMIIQEKQRHKTKEAQTDFQNEKFQDMEALMRYI